MRAASQGNCPDLAVNPNVILVKRSVRPPLPHPGAFSRENFVAELSVISLVSASFVFVITTSTVDLVVVVVVVVVDVVVDVVKDGV